MRQFARVLGTPSARAGPNSVASTASLAAAVSLPTPGKSFSESSADPVQYLKLPKKMRLALMHLYEHYGGL